MYLVKTVEACNQKRKTRTHRNANPEHSQLHKSGTYLWRKDKQLGTGNKDVRKRCLRNGWTECSFTVQAIIPHWNCRYTFLVQLFTYFFFSYLTALQKLRACLYSAEYKNSSSFTSRIQAIRLFPISTKYVLPSSVGSSDTSVSFMLII